MTYLALSCIIRAMSRLLDATPSEFLCRSSSHSKVLLLGEAFSGPESKSSFHQGSSR